MCSTKSGWSLRTANTITFTIHATRTVKYWLYHVWFVILANYPSLSRPIKSNYSRKTPDDDTMQLSIKLSTALKEESEQTQQFGSWCAMSVTNHVSNILDNSGKYILFSNQAWSALIIFGVCKQDWSNECSPVKLSHEQKEAKASSLRMPR
jgi:hypothetical protein